MNARKTNTSGTMIVEFVLSLTIWAALLGGLILMGRIVLAQHRAQRLARYGTMLQSTGRLDPAVVEQELEDYAGALSGGLSAPWQFETGRFNETSSSVFYKLMQTQVKGSVAGSPLSVSEIVVCQQEASGK